MEAWRRARMPGKTRRIMVGLRLMGRLEVCEIRAICWSDLSAGKRPGKKGGGGGVSELYDLPDSEEQRSNRDESPNIFQDDTPALARASPGMQEEEKEEERHREEQWREDEVSRRGKRTRKQEVIPTKAQAKRSKISPAIARDPPPTISQLTPSREARGR